MFNAARRVAPRNGRGVHGRGEVFSASRQNIFDAIEQLGFFRLKLRDDDFTIV